MQEKVTEKGIVVNSANGFVEIELLSNDHCEECSAKIFCSPNSESKKTLKINTSSNFNIGEKVDVIIEGKNLLFASFNLYLYPLLLIIIALFLGMKIFSNTNSPEIYSFLISIVLVTIYYLIFFMISKKVNSVEPKILLSDLK